MIDALAELVEVATHGRIAAATLGRDSSLASLDSVEVLELVVVLEERFAIRLDERDLVRANWETFGHLVDLVARAARPAP